MAPWISLAQDLLILIIYGNLPAGWAGMLQSRGLLNAWWLQRVSQCIVQKFNIKRLESIDFYGVPFVNFWYMSTAFLIFMVPVFMFSIWIFNFMVSCFMIGIQHFICMVFQFSRIIFRFSFIVFQFPCLACQELCSVGCFSLLWRQLSIFSVFNCNIENFIFALLNFILTISIINSVMSVSKKQQNIL